MKPAVDRTALWHVVSPRVRGVPWSWMLAAISLSLVVALCLTIARHAESHRTHWTAATCVARGCYCEADAAHGPREPIDAWSSLAPAVAGAVLLFVGTAQPRRRDGTTLVRSRVPTLLLAASASSIAVFSFHYHATHTLAGEWLDGVSLYLLAGFAIAWGIARALRWGGGGFALLFVAIAAVPAALAWTFPSLRKVLFLALVLLAVVVELLGRRRAGITTQLRWLLLSLASFAVAITAWALDWTRVVCNPHSRLQLHAVWHLLSAPTVLSLHAYFASERELTTTLDASTSGLRTAVSR